jgi:hypothetical protein
MAITKKIENGKVVYRLDGKTKLYPICSWEKNQHKIYNAHDRAVNWCYESNHSDEAEANLERVERMMDVIDGIIINGIVYGTWEDYKLIKDCTVAYDVRH